MGCVTITRHHRQSLPSHKEHMTSLEETLVLILKTSVQWCFLESFLPCPACLPVAAFKEQYTSLCCC